MQPLEVEEQRNAQQPMLQGPSLTDQRRKKVAIIAAALTLLFLAIYACDAYLDNDEDDDDKEDHSKHTRSAMIVQRDTRDDFLKAATDFFEYEFFNVSENGLSALLIKTPNNGLYPVGVAVTISDLGAYSDPYPEGEGLSHFLEHLVFLGSRQYEPAVSGSYLSTVWRSGGTPNGLTALDWTLYPTTLPQSALLEDVMRRTADFLAEPLLNNDDLKREINAVSSEYYISIAEGGTRTIWNMIHLLADPQHPFSHFQVGNNNSLQAEVSNVTKVRLHHSKYYESSHMQLVLQVNANDAQKAVKLAQDIFAKIPHKDKSTQQTRILETQQNSKFQLIQTSLFNSTVKGCFYYVANQVSNVRELAIFFELGQLNKQTALYLQLLLKLYSPCPSLRQNYVFECSAEFDVEGQISGDQSRLLSVKMILSDVGYENTDVLFFYVLKYFETLRNKLLKPEKNFLEQTFGLAQNLIVLNFNYQQQQDAFETLIERALAFKLNPNSKDFLFEDLQLNDDNLSAQKVAEALQEVKLENSVVILRSQKPKENLDSGLAIKLGLSKSLESKQHYKSSLYQLDFVQADLTAVNFGNKDTLEKANQLLQNVQFVTDSIEEELPHHFEMLNDLPTNLHNSSSDLLVETVNSAHRFYYLPDASYRAPLEYIKLHIESTNPTILSSQRAYYYNFLLANVLSFVLGDSLVHQDEFGVQATLPCFELNCGKSLYQLGKLISTVLRGDGSTLLSDSEEVSGLRKQLKEYGKYLLNKRGEGTLVAQLLEELQIFLQPKSQRLHQEELMALINIEGISNDNIQEFRQEYLQSLRLTMLAAGNLQPQRAKALFHYTLDYWGFLKASESKSQEGYKRIFQLYDISHRSEVVRSYQCTLDHNNGATLNYYAITEEVKAQLQQSAVSKKSLQKLELILKGYAFEYLRSQKQLGYVATAKILQIGPQKGIAFFVVGYRFSPAEVDHEIENLLAHAETKLESLSESEATTLFEAEEEEEDAPYHLGDISLFARADRVWKEILQKRWVQDDQNSGADDSQHEAEKIVTKQQLINAFKIIFKDSRNKVSIQLYKLQTEQELQSLDNLLPTNIDSANQNNFFYSQDSTAKQKVQLSLQCQAIRYDSNGKLVNFEVKDFQ